MTAFPQYARAESTENIRAHFLGAAACWNEAHEALLLDDKRRAFDQMELCLALVIEARKSLLEVHAVPQERNPEPVERAAPLKCPHGTDLDIPCVECLQEAEKKQEAP